MGVHLVGDGSDGYSEECKNMGFGPKVLRGENTKVVGEVKEGEKGKEQQQKKPNGSINQIEHIYILDWAETSW